MMSDRSGLLNILKRRLSGFPICARIAIGNAAIITAGATAGLVAARLLVGAQIPLLLTILLFILWIGLCILASYFVTRLALRPLIDLRRFSETPNPSTATPFTTANPDPDTCQVASTLNDLLTQLESSNRQLKAVASRSIGVQEEERKRIARWLHDDTSQALAILILQLERLERRIPDYEIDVRNEIKNARQLAAKTLGELRKIIHGLRPSILDDLGLASAIRWYARATLEEAGVQVAFHSNVEKLKLPPEQTTTLFRIAQEAINNIAHHAQAQNARISLQRSGSEVFLEIEDDGRGFQVSGDTEDAILKRHWGLIGIQERLERVGGHFSLNSEPSKGTLLQIYAPLRELVEVDNEPEDPHPVG